jgi:HAE1 family hydrophobic/amphiphilic exporter-1/multidrug efflux pump
VDDPIKLASYGLYRFRVRAALNQQNVELPSGKLTGDNTELTVKQLETLQLEEV